MENKSGKNLLSFVQDYNGIRISTPTRPDENQLITATISGTRHHDDAIDAMRYCYNDIITTMHYAHWTTHGIEKVIFHDPATIVYWCDGTKTVVKCCKDDVFDPEKGLSMAICKRYLGENFKKVFKEFIPEEKEIEEDKKSPDMSMDAFMVKMNKISEMLRLH